MRLSRHSKIACACVAAVLVALVALPTGAAAQGAPEEYDLAGLPNAGGDEQPSKGEGQAATKLASELGTSRASGGAPVLLIAIAVIGAVAAGLGAWRLRRSTDDPGPDS